MNRPPRKRSPRGSLPFVFCELPPKPQCAKCGDTRLTRYGGSSDNGDGSVWRYVRCEACGQRQIVVLEPQELG